MKGLVISYSVFSRADPDLRCVGSRPSQEISDAKNALEMFCRGPEKSVALASLDLRAS